METENTTTVEEIEFNFSTDYVLKETAVLPAETYKNTIRKNPHRRRITVVSQVGNVIDADVEHFQAEDGEQDGTPITAETMDAFHKVIAQADENAKNSFNMTNEIANRVAEYLQQSNQNVLNLEQQITHSQGTKVQVDGEYVASFDANTKLDVTTFNNKEIISNVSYDSATNTFNF